MIPGLTPGPVTEVNNLYITQQRSIKMITIAITAVVAFLAGVLVGRNNPTEASVLSAIASKAQAVAKKI